MFQFLRNTIRKHTSDAYRYDPISGEVYTLDDFDIVETEEELEFFIDEKCKWHIITDGDETYTESDFTEFLYSVYESNGYDLKVTSLVVERDPVIVRDVLNRIENGGDNV